MKIRQSRWVKLNNVPRYDAKLLDAIWAQYREADGWSKGARVVKRGR